MSDFSNKSTDELRRLFNTDIENKKLIGKELLLREHCGDVEDIRTMCRKLFPDRLLYVDGDTYGVPELLDLADLMRKEILYLRHILECSKPV